VTPGRPQSWTTCDADIRSWVERVVSAVRYELRGDLVGVYLHGSLATGSFRRAKSDVDLLIVTRAPLDEITRRRLASAFLGIWRLRPITGTLELHVVLADAARHHVHPMPYELSWDDKRADDSAPLGGRDPDLAAHCAMTRARGVALIGPPPAEVFGEVQWSDYLDAVLADLAWILNDDHIVESPFYGVLNACRVLEMLDRGPGITSNKEESGRWAQGVVPVEHLALVARALEVYCSDDPVSLADRQVAGIAWDVEALRRFRDWVRAEVERRHPAPNVLA
jgi:predicted nucleotidyltransferase